MLHFEEVMVGSGGSVACARCGSTGAPPAFREAEDISSDIRDAVAAWGAGAGPNIALIGADAYSHPGL